MFDIECAHNDIKPENILITPSSFILHDLGIASYVSSFKEKITEINGTLLYMSPAKYQHYLHCVDQNLI
jgi:serine/threonine protein kinase